MKQIILATAILLSACSSTKTLSRQIEYNERLVITAADGRVVYNSIWKSVPLKPGRYKVLSSASEHETREIVMK
jgi:hypothetical protein